MKRLERSNESETEKGGCLSNPRYQRGSFSQFGHWPRGGSRKETCIFRMSSIRTSVSHHLSPDLHHHYPSLSLTNSFPQYQTAQTIEISPQRLQRHPQILLNHLAFADDIVLLVPSRRKAETLFAALAALERNALSIGLSVNYTKTKFMAVGLCACHKDKLRGRKRFLDKVYDFCYLSSYIRSSAVDFAIRRGQAFAAMNRLWRVWRSKISRDCKIRVSRHLSRASISMVWTRTASPRLYRSGLMADTLGC